uniref:Uncharacterized protein n=1 Tax=candidate division CPR3 bacterium TaxID=2268181 RepID=A0A7C5URN9_UNCC3
MRFFQVQTNPQLCGAHIACSCDWENFLSKKEAVRYAKKLVEEADEEGVEATVSLCSGEEIDDFSPDYLATAAKVRKENGKISVKNTKIQRNTGRNFIFWGGAEYRI